jgi:perosamine synthetase
VHLHEPRFAGREWEYVKQCLDTGWVSSVGQFVRQFEERLAVTCGTKAAIAMVNGTSALHLALRVVGVLPEDEVIIPTLTFVATANAVTYCGALPHFVDSEEGTFGIDANKLKAHLRQVAIDRGEGLVNKATGRRIRAVVPVHVFGHPVQICQLSAVCEEFALPFVEDATESLGSLYRNRPCGGLGMVGVLSFNGNKIVTTGGGGALVTNDEELARRARHLATTARVPHRWGFVHDETGWNYRMPNLNAALGLAQVEQLEEFVTAKRALAKRYASAFAGVQGVTFVTERPETVSNYWLNALLVHDDSGQAREEMLQTTNDKGVMTRPVWTLMHRLGMFRGCPRSKLEVAESIERRLVNLPSSASLAMRE